MDCRISEKEQVHERLLLLRGIAGDVLDATLQEKEATKTALAKKKAEAVALRAARDSSYKKDQRDGQPPTKEPPK